MPKNMSVENRWRQKVRTGPGCWEWTASRDRDGYGRFQYPTPTGQAHIRAHRWAYLHFIGSIPIGMVVCHSCDNPWCVRPSHLWLGTPLENNTDKVAKGRHAVPWGTPLLKRAQTHCKRGHPLSGTNLWIYSRTGHRRCRECAALLARRSYRRRHGLPGDGQPRPRREVQWGEVA